MVELSEFVCQTIIGLTRYACRLWVCFYSPTGNGMGSFNMYVITSLFATFTALSSLQFDGAYPGELC